MNYEDGNATNPNTVPIAYTATPALFNGSKKEHPSFSFSFSFESKTSIASQTCYGDGDLVALVVVL